MRFGIEIGVPASAVVGVEIPREPNGQTRIELHAGPSFPLGHYADNDGIDPGWAQMGVSALANVAGSLPLTPGLEWFATTGVTLHEVQDEYADALGLSDPSIHPSIGRYVTVPLVIGPRYRLPLTTNTSAYLFTQFGLFFLRGPEFETDLGTVTYDVATKTGFAIGGGIDLWRRFGLSGRFVPLGIVESEIGTSSGSLGEVEQRQSYADVFLALRIF